MNVHFSSSRDNWETPQEFFDLLDSEFHFTLDAAADPANAKVPSRYYTLEDDAIRQDWPGVVFCNPPYGRMIGRFVRKAWEQAQEGSTVVMLIPARTDTSYWHEFVMRSAEIRLVRGRLRFGGTDNSAPFPSAVVVFRPKVEGPPKISSIGRA